MNILAGLSSLTALVLISTSRVPDVAGLGGGATAMASVTAGFLVVSSVLALLGKPRGRRLMLAAALAFYGGILIQNAYLLGQVQDNLAPAHKLITHVVRSGLEIAINLWALLSAKTRRYFDGVLAAPWETSLGR